MDEGQEKFEEAIRFSFKAPPIDTISANLNMLNFLFLVCSLLFLCLFDLYNSVIVDTLFKNNIISSDGSNIRNFELFDLEFEYSKVFDLYSTIRNGIRFFF